MSANRVEIRIPHHLIRPLDEAMLLRGRGERVAFGLASHARTPDRDILLVTKIIPLADTDYVPTFSHGAKWQGRAMLAVMNEAVRLKLGIVLLHTHSHPGPVALSDDDRESAGRLLPVFENAVPERAHASVVFGEDCATGIVTDPAGPALRGRVRLRFLGKAIRDRDAEPPPVAAAAEEIYETQALLTGGAGEFALRRARVTVVGLSGGGSHMVQQLTHMGPGEIAGIDHDRSDSAQQSRLIGLTPSDAKRRRRKTAVMAALVRRISSDVKFISVPSAVPEQAAIEAIKASDVIVGCVDNYHARADLMTLASRYMIPYIDIGLLIRPTANTGRIEIGGHVATFIPGSFCAWCIGHVSKEKLDLETGGRPKSYFQGASRQAQVVSMNGLLASAAATEVLQLLTGFRGDEDDPEMVIRKYDGIEGTLVKWHVKKKTDCELCGGTLGAGDPVWTPA
jgi:molybdopterin/thiamine biosynthesis adenylyltransferase